MEWEGEETYGELDGVVGERDVAPHDLVDLGGGGVGAETGFAAQSGDGLGEGLGAVLEVGVGGGCGGRRR